MRVLISPLITEKSISRVADGRYSFKVAAKANKPLIAEAINHLYKVNVVKVNIIRMKDENVLIRGRYPARKKGCKKAIVTLKKGQKIPGFEEK